MRKEIRLAGFGGQGIGLAGFLLGKAFALYDDKHSVMTQSYGPEARGGASSTNIVVADRPIDFPFVQHPDFLVLLSQEAYTKFRSSAKPDALVLIDEGLVQPCVDDHPYTIPSTKIAESLGRRIVTNVVMLGYFTSVTGMVSRDAMEKSLKNTLPSKILPLNLKAFASGFEYAGETQELLT